VQTQRDRLTILGYNPTAMIHLDHGANCANGSRASRVRTVQTVTGNHVKVQVDLQFGVDSAGISIGVAIAFAIR
jgi:hypothetical protein